MSLGIEAEDIDAREPFPRSIILLSVIFAAFLGLSQFLIVTMKQSISELQLSTIQLLQYLMNYQVEVGFSRFQLLTALSINCLQFFFFSLFVCYLVVILITYIQTKLPHYDKGKQLLDDEGTHAEISLKTIFACKRNGIPYHQMFVYVILISFFFSSTLGLIWLPLYHTPANKILLLLVGTFFVISNVIIFLFQNRLPLIRLRIINYTIIILSLKISYDITRGEINPGYIFLGLLVVYIGFLLSFIKMRRPIRVHIDRGESVDRFFANLQPLKQFYDIPQNILYCLVGTFFYQVRTLLNFMILVIDSMERSVKSPIEIYQIVIFYLLLLMLEVFFIYLLMTQLDLKQVELVFTNTIAILFLIYLSWIIFDDLMGYVIFLILSSDNLMFETLLYFEIIPSGILTGLALGVLFKIRYPAYDYTNRAHTYPDANL